MLTTSRSFRKAAAAALTGALAALVAAPSVVSAQDGVRPEEAGASPAGQKHPGLLSTAVLQRHAVGIDGQISSRQSAARLAARTASAQGTTGADYRTIDEAARKGIEPSDTFASFASQALITVDRVRLLKTQLIDLKDRYDDCRVLSESHERGRVACRRNPALGGLGTDTVLMSYLAENQVIACIELYFEDPDAARAAYRRLAGRLDRRFDTREQVPGQVLDSPFWRLSLQAAALGEGKWLRVEPRSFADLCAAERFARQGQAADRTGALTVGAVGR